MNYEGLTTEEKLEAIDNENMQDSTFFNRLSEAGHSDIQWYCNG